MTRSAPVALEAARELADVDPAAPVDLPRRDPGRQPLRGGQSTFPAPTDKPTVVKRVLAERKRQGLSEYVQNISALDRIAETLGG